MDRKQGLLGYYNYTVILTYVGMLSGFLGAVCAVREYYFQAVICLMFSGFCDMFDGAVAATRQRTANEKSFGIEIDSFSDLICFGILPALLCCSMNRGAVMICIAALYALCALIRLSYFNVDEHERQRKSSQPREIYYGMPVTLSAVFIPAVYCIFTICSWRTDIAVAVTLVIMGVLFLVPVPLQKPRAVGKAGFILIGAALVVLLLVAHKFI